MRGAMIRNTRAVVALKLPRRNATTIKVDGGAHEAAPAWRFSFSKSMQIFSETFAATRFIHPHWN